MSITPYINSSIIMQLLTAVIPTLEEWRKDGQEGYKRIQKVTRYFTVFLAAVQAFGMTYALRINNALVVYRCFKYNKIYKENTRTACGLNT